MWRIFQVTTALCSNDRQLKVCTCRRIPVRVALLPCRSTENGTGHAQPRPSRRIISIQVFCNYRASEVLSRRALIHRLHVVSKAVFGHLSPELGTVSTGMLGMYSAPHARIVGFLADFREGMPMTGHAEDRRIHDVCGYFVGTEEVLQDLCC